MDKPKRGQLYTRTIIWTTKDGIVKSVEVKVKCRWTWNEDGDGIKVASFKAVEPCPREDPTMTYEYYCLKKNWPVHNQHPLVDYIIHTSINIKDLFHQD